MHKSRFDAILSSQSTVAQKVFAAIPENTTWASDTIYFEVRRRGQTAAVRRVVDGCIKALTEAGLLQEHPKGKFQRVIPHKSVDRKLDKPAKTEKNTVIPAKHEPAVRKMVQAPTTLATLVVPEVKKEIAEIIAKVVVPPPQATPHVPKVIVKRAPAPAPVMPKPETRLVVKEDAVTISQVLDPSWQCSVVGSPTTDYTSMVPPASLIQLTPQYGGRQSYTYFEKATPGQVYRFPKAAADTTDSAVAKYRYVRNRYSYVCGYWLEVHVFTFHVDIYVTSHKCGNLDKARNFVVRNYKEMLSLIALSGRLIKADEPAEVKMGNTDEINKEPLVKPGTLIRRSNDINVDKTVTVEPEAPPPVDLTVTEVKEVVTATTVEVAEPLVEVTEVVVATPVAEVAAVVAKPVYSTEDVAYWQQVVTMCMQRGRSAEEAMADADGIMNRIIAMRSS